MDIPSRDILDIFQNRCPFQQTNESAAAVPIKTTLHFHQQHKLIKNLQVLMDQLGGPRAKNVCCKNVCNRNLIKLPATDRQSIVCIVFTRGRVHMSI